MSLLSPRSGRFVLAAAATSSTRPMGTVEEGTTRAAVHVSRSPATTTLQVDAEISGTGGGGSNGHREPTK
ncbi:hypothetical protein E2562_020883 [Oryza meyeriana var. granulata]|uniref:Uncharacterized protein n=1 Tax=Oryza meyeriana var. granulata TaxID=110450 RepID=A0A6G1D605_9ORYZ|nr:hypothetical protein E2562_020883 [Oryza meyeriana var. granulata]